MPGTSELSLLFVDRPTIAELNERFLGGTGPTDVLAFPMDDDLVLPRPPARPGRPGSRRAERGRGAADPDRRRRRVPGRGAGAGARARVRRSTTSSRCSSCTASCISSTTTTPIRVSMRRCSSANASCSPASASQEQERDDPETGAAPDAGGPAVSGADWAIVARGHRCCSSLRSCSPLAETAFTRMSRIRALSLEEEGRKGAHRLALMLERPERTLNVLLLLVLVAQMTSASLLGILLERVVRQRRPVHRPRAPDRPVLRDRRGRAEDLRDPAPRPGRAARLRRSSGRSRTSRRCGCSRAVSSASPTSCSRARA